MPLCRFRPFIPFALLALLGGAVCAAQPASPPAVLTIHADRPGARISPLLYGIFFEEINHAGDGGLYAELLRNRSFEDAETPAGWSAVARGGAKGTLAL